MSLANSITQSDRIGIIATLAQRKPDIGATALMKSVYLLQELYDVPLGYDFTIYTYGPYSAQVIYDVDASAMGKFVTFTYVQAGNSFRRNYRIGEKFEETDLSFSSQFEEQIAQVINEFSGRTAYELELAATIVYTYAYYKRNELEMNDEIIINAVHKIKPHFTIDKIKSEYENLNNKKFLN